MFLTGNIFFGKFGPENQNCWFKLKFGMYFCKFEYPEFCGVHFLSFKPTIPFLGKFGPKKTELSVYAEICKANWSLQN